MTFAAKYEILEAVTRGAVETFVARKVATDERVLVYIFECQEQQPNKPTVQWVLESFRAVAPDPPELVSETGRYDATSYGYLVTKLPEKSKLQAWVQSYEARQQGATGAVVPPANASATGAEESAKEVADVPASERPTRVLGFDQPEEITKAFEALRSELKPPSAADSSPTAVHVDRADPGTISAELRKIGLERTAVVQPNATGDFTRKFFPGVRDEPGITSAQSGPPPRGELSAKGTEDRKRADAATDTPSAILRKIVFPPTGSVGSTGLDASVRSGTAPQPKPAPTSAPNKAGTTSTGDFTGFFRGPFDGERPAQTPDLSPTVAREQKDTGDFTRVFGPPKRESAVHVTSSPSTDRNPSAASGSGSFTSLFESTEVPKKTSSAPESPVPSGERLEANPSGFSTAKEQTSPTPVPRPARMPADFPSPPASSGASSEPALPFSSRSEMEGATRAFSATEREPAPGLSTLQAGPSEYTRIISVGSRKPSASVELPAQPGPQSLPSENVALPSSVPAMPVAPSFPQFPTGGYPQMPAPSPIASVPAPQVPPRGPAAAPKSAGPPWTMILFLNGLFILAVLLVVYFVLRH